jgi:hypothetical protein
MAMYNSERQVGDDGDSLTDMSDACLAELISHDDTKFQRNVGYIRDVFDQKLT